MGSAEAVVERIHGYLAMNAREFLRTDVVIFCILLYALLGKASDLAARWLERRLLPWHLAYRDHPS